MDILSALSKQNDGIFNNDGYWCVVCYRYIQADEHGLIVHDNIYHPENMSFDEDEKPQ